MHSLHLGLGCLFQHLGIDYTLLIQAWAIRSHTQEWITLFSSRLGLYAHILYLGMSFTLFIQDWAVCSYTQEWATLSSSRLGLYVSTPRNELHSVFLGLGYRLPYIGLGYTLFIYAWAIYAPIKYLGMSYALFIQTWATRSYTQEWITLSYIQAWETRSNTQEWVTLSLSRLGQHAIIARNGLHSLTSRLGQHAPTPRNGLHSHYLGIDHTLFILGISHSPRHGLYALHARHELHSPYPRHRLTDLVLVLCMGVGQLAANENIKIRTVFEKPLQQTVCSTTFTLKFQ